VDRLTHFLNSINVLDFKYLIALNLLTIYNNIINLEKLTFKKVITQNLLWWLSYSY